MPELQMRSALGREARIVNMSELGKALTELDAEPPVKAMVVYNSNPAAIAPNQNLVLRGLRREDLFTVVLEQFQTDTADHADILLPVDHVSGTYGSVSGVWALPSAIGEARGGGAGEARSNVEIFRALAKRMGFEDPCFRGFRRPDDRRAAWTRAIRSWMGSRWSGWNGSIPCGLNISPAGEAFPAVRAKAGSERRRANASSARRRWNTGRRWNRDSAMPGSAARNIRWNFCPRRTTTA